MTGRDDRRWPAPRSVFCVYASSYQRREVADNACRGVFDHVGVVLDVGPDPDWMDDTLHPDEEWQIDWSKFYFGLDLATAFDQTGDQRYVDAFVRLAGGFIAQVPVDRDTSDTAARRVSNWMYAWMLFGESPRFTGFGGFEPTLLDGIRSHVHQIRNNLTPERNHRTLELYSLFIVALALPNLDPNGELLRFTIDELDRDMQESLYPDGVHYECSTHYHMIVLRSYLALGENARRFGLDLPPQFEPRLTAACEFALHIHRPDGAIPAFSDADTGSYHDVLELAADLVGREDFRYGASAGRRGVRPAAGNVSFPDGGYFVQRSGWGETTPFEQERFLLFDCGPIGRGGHGHYDALSLELAAYGRPLIMDPGRYTYSEYGEDNLRHWFKGTAAHNTITVDGLDQTPYRRGKPKRAAEARFRSRLSADGLDLLDGEVHSQAYGAVHRRRILFVAGEYWIILDDVVDEAPHRYDLRWHLAPQDRAAVTVTGSEPVHAVRAFGLGLAIGGTVGKLTLEDGWIAPLYGVLEPAPVVSVAADGLPAARFVTVAYPLAGTAPPPDVRIAVGRSENGRASTSAETTIAIDTDRGGDLIIWTTATGDQTVKWKRAQGGTTVREAQVRS